MSTEAGYFIRIPNFLLIYKSLHNFFKRNIDKNFGIWISKPALLDIFKSFYKKKLSQKSDLGPKNGITHQSSIERTSAP